MLWDVNLLWTAIAALVLWFPQNLAHEGAHALAARHWGSTILKIWPFPNTHNDGFSFAYVIYKWGPVTPENLVHGIVSAAPQLANTFVLSLLVPMHWRFRAETPDVLAAVLTAWALVNFVDGAVNLATFYRPVEKPTTDGWKWAARFGLTAWQGRAVAAAWHLWFGYHLFVPGP